MLNKLNSYYVKYFIYIFVLGTITVYFLLQLYCCWWICTVVPLYLFIYLNYYSMSEIYFKDVNYLDPFVKIPVSFEGVLHLRFTDSDYKVYKNSFLICGYPQCHLIKKFRKGLSLCLIPVFTPYLNRKTNLYHICYVQA